MTAVFSADPATGCRPGAFGNATHLVCRACGAHSPLGPFYACLECFGPLEVGYAFPTITRAEIEAGPQSIWRYAPLLPVPADIATFRSTDPGLHPAGRRPPPGRRPRPAAAVGQGRLRQPHPLLQGPGRRRRPVRRPRARPAGAGLPVHRQPGQRRGRRGRPGRHPLGRLRAREPRAAEDHRLRRLRHHAGRGAGHATTT